MARRRDFIRDIDNTKNTLKLAVRIIDLWFVETKDKSEQAEMIIMDENTDKIHVLIKKEELKTWKLTLKENNTYMMHNFKIVNNEGQYKLCLHPYKLIFTGVTVVIKQDLPNIPSKAYDFINFANILAGTYRRDLLVDAIGVVHELTSHHIYNSPKRVIFSMKDLSGQTVTCTLWDDLCLQLVNYLRESGGMETVVIMLTHARIKEAQGLYPITITNTWQGSKLFINESLPEIQQFKERVGVSLPIGVPTLTSSQKGHSLSQTSGSSQYSEKEKFFYKAEVKSLSQINDITTPTDCVTIGTIGRIIVDNHGWCYASCMKCNKSAVVENGPFRCSCGKYNEGSILRYKVEVMVYYKKQTSNFVLWDRECIDLIGKSAQELNDMMFAGGDKSVNVFPDPLDDILGCTFAFKIKVQPKYRNSSVNKISNDPELMQAIIDLLSDVEDSTERQVHLSSEVEDTATHQHALFNNEHDSFQYGTQSLSETTNHNPEVTMAATPTNKVVDEVANHRSQPGIAITPSKRHLIEVFPDDNLSKQFLSAQSSTTKKHIKNE